MQGTLRIFYLVFATICQLGIILQVGKLRLKTSSSQGQHIKELGFEPRLVFGPGFKPLANPSTYRQPLTDQQLPGK